MSVLRRSRDLVDLADLSYLHPNGPTPEPYQDPTHSRLVGRRLQSRLSNSQPSSSRAVEQRNTGKPNATQEQESASQEAATRSPRHVNNGINKPLPPPPTTVIISSTLTSTPTPVPVPTPTLSPTPFSAPRPNLRSRFNAGPALGQAPETENPRVILVPQHVDPDLSITAVLSPPREKRTHYRPATGDLWPFLDMAAPPSRRPQREPGGEVTGQQHQQQQEGEPTASSYRGEQKEPTEDRQEKVKDEKKEEEQEAEDEKPSDYELFVQQAREKDPRYREQLLRIFSRRGARDGGSGSAQKKATHRDLDRPRMFSWQRAAAKRQQEEDSGGDGGDGGGVRRSWGASETVKSQQNPSTRKRHSDIGPSNSGGGGLRRKGSMSSLSSMGKALANYIKPQKSPHAL